MRMKGKMNEGRMCSKYFVHMYENRKMKPVKIILTRWRGNEEE
jgi:hypothetical protein